MFSHTKDKAAVLAYVDAGFDVTGQSALDYRSLFISLSPGR
jgi:hypothetical protein